MGTNSHWPGPASLSGITVVIATLGGDSLSGTIERLNQGSVVPDEILICIPANEAFRVQSLNYSNVVVLTTSYRGQVAQRAFGFINASRDVVMQLDDDIFVDGNCVERLLNTLKSQDADVAVAPALINLSTGESVYSRPKRNQFIQKTYDWLVNGFGGCLPGKIYKSGLPAGVDPKVERAELIEAEWLPGGCVMHHRKNLILENFYPFPGKAYCEDLIHSHLLQAKGVRLLINTVAICQLEVTPLMHAGITQYFNELKCDFRARKYFMDISSRKSLRIYILYVLHGFLYLCRRLMQNWNSYQSIK